MYASLIKYITFIFCCATAAQSATVASVSQWGITFTFDRAYTAGQFANGDWWVQGPVTISAITPDATADANGWMVNPMPGENSFDSRVPGFISSRTPSLPYTAQGGESVVKSISRDRADETAAGCGSSGSDRNCLQTAAVLTVLSEVPAGDGAALFRPAYCGTTKTLRSVDDLRWDLLPSLDPSRVLFRKTLAEVKTDMERVYLDHLGVMANQQLHPDDYMPSYGANFSVYMNERILSLFFDETQAEKEPALIAAVQVGIDLYGMVRHGHTWGANGGHGPGRKMPVCFAAVMLDDTEMKDAMLGSGIDIFQDDQVLYWSEKANNGDGVVLFGVPYDESRYWDLVITDGGNRIGADPYGYIDAGHVPGTSYQQCCNSPCYKGEALVLRAIPEVAAVWGHDRLLQYAERWVTHGAWAQHDPCAPADSLDMAADAWPATASGNYGVTYGPDPGNPGDCIRDTDSTDGIGRFPAEHGLRANTGNRNSNFQDFFWNAYWDSLGTVGIGQTVHGTAAAPAVRLWNNPVRAGSGKLLTAELPAGFTGPVSIVNQTGTTVRQLDTVTGIARWNGCGTDGFAVLPGVYYLVVETADGQSISAVSVLP